MVRLYIGEENIPKDKHFINDVEAAFPAVPIVGSDFQRLVIETVDKGKYYNSKQFIDRFGYLLTLDSLSTGSKSMLLLDYARDSVVNLVECGDNALILLSLIKDCSVYLPDRDMAFPFTEDYPVVCNNKEWEGVSQLNDWLC